MAHKEGNADLSKESKHPSEFQIHVQHLTEEKSGLCCQLLSGSNYKEIKELFALAWPTVFSYFFYHMVNMISLFFAGRVGEVELAAATLALSFINVTGPSLFIGLSSAVETLCSQAFGAKNYHLVGVVLQRGVWILGLTCILAWSLWVNTELLLLLIQQEETIARLTQDFILICIPALIGNFLFILLQRYLQTQGIVKPILYVCVIANGIQIGLNALMAMVLKLGFRGVAISWALTVCILTSLLFAYMKVFKLHIKTWPGWTTESLLNWSQFFKLAVSGMFMTCVEIWSFQSGAFLTGTLGEVQLASFGILFSWAAFVFMIPLGLSVAAGVRVGNFLGAGNPKAVKKTIKVALGLIVSVELIILTVFLGLGDISGRVFTSSSDVLVVYKRNILIVSVMFFFDGIQGVCSGIVRGAGRQRIGVLINFLSFFVALSVGITLMFFVFHESAGLWIGISTGVFLQACLYLFLLWRTDWDKQAELAQRRSAAKTVRASTSEDLLNGDQAGHSAEKNKDLILASWISKTSSLPFLNHMDANNSQFRLALLSNDGSTSEKDSRQGEIESEATANIKRMHSLTSAQKRALIVKRLIPLVISLMILGGAVAVRFLIPLP
ncbi:multidrug and toxin extrusion protein 2-like [Porites lutea]|uniref:multidrug and toxin extrusion protein 2-like n=1 Tax=Porites lutea TaxID=51062 RepID=UPI003CC60EC1